MARAVSKRDNHTKFASYLGAGVVPGLRKALRFIATRGDVLGGFIGGARTSGNCAVRHRFRQYIGAGGVKAGTLRAAVNAIQISSLAETNGAGYEVRGHIEVAGVAYPFTWGGQPAGNVPAGAAEYLSDPVSGLPNLAADTLVWVVLYRLYAVGAQPIYVSSTVTNPAIAGEALQLGAAGLDPLIGTPGAFGNPSGWTSTGALAPPMALLGEPIDKTKPAIFVVGASIERGVDARELNGDGANGAGGYIRIGLSPANGTKYAHAIVAASGESTFSFLASNAKRKAYAKYADVLVIGHGGNDFTNGAASAATLQRFIDIAALLRAEGPQRVGCIRMAPKSDSTDGWVTAANQSPKSGFLDFRSLIDAGVVAAGMKLIDVTPAYEAAPGIWKDGAVDENGTHPLAPIHANAGPLLQGAMGSLLNPLAA